MCLWLFLYQKKFADVLNGILQKTLASISILQTQNYKSAEKFVNIPSKIYKKVSGNKRKQIQNCTTN